MKIPAQLLHLALAGLAFMFAVSTAHAQIAPGAIAGTVGNTATGRLLEGATLEIVGTGRSAFTDSSGRFLVAGLAPGDYEIVASYTGLTTVRETVRVSPGAVTARSFDLTAEIYRLEKFVVAGEREGNAASITRQRTAPNVKNVIALDAMGTLANDNVGELLVRLPGIAGRPDEAGEVSGVQIRGMEPAMNSVAVDGSRMASSGGMSRDFRVHVLTGAMFDEIEVNKAPTPDMDADSLGGAVNLKTRSPLALKEARRLSYRLSGRWAPPFFDHIPMRRDEPVQPLVNLSYQGKFSIGGGEPNLGVSLTAFYSKIARPTDGLRYDYAYSTAEPAYVWDYYTYNNLDVRRQRTLNLKLDYQLSPHTRVHLGGLYNDAFGYNLRLQTRAFTGRTLVAYNAAGAPTGTGAIYPDYTAAVTRVRGVAASVFELNSTSQDFDDMQRQLKAGAEHTFGAWKLDYDASYSHSHAVLDDGLFQGVPGTGGIFTMRVAAVGWQLDKRADAAPRFAQTEGASIFNPANYGTGLASLRNQKRVGELAAASANLSYDSIANLPLSVKAGARVRRQSAGQTSGNDGQFTYVGPDGVAGTADDRPGLLAEPTLNPSHWGTGTLPFVRPSLVGENIKANARAWQANPYYTEAQKFTFFRDVNEDVTAAYASARGRLGSLGILAGLRLEQTEVSGAGYVPSRVQTTTARRAADPVGSARADNDNLRRIRGSYTDWFPGVHLVHKFTPGLQGRVSWSNGIGRPAFSNLVPRETANDTARTLTINNPSLRPQYSRNWDASLEYYFEPVGMLSAGVFRKEMRDFIVSSTSGMVGSGPANGYNGDYSGYTLISSFNGGAARVQGVELAYSQQYTFLPGFLRGLSGFANYTWLHTEGDYGGTATRSTAEVANFIPHLANGGISYAYRGFSSRLLVNYTGSFLTDYSADAFRLRYKFARVLVNLNLGYRIYRHLELFWNFENLLNEPQKWYRYRQSQLERITYSGSHVNFGISGTF